MINKLLMPFTKISKRTVCLLGLLSTLGTSLAPQAQAVLVGEEHFSTTIKGAFARAKTLEKQLQGNLCLVVLEEKEPLNDMFTKPGTRLATGLRIDEKHVLLAGNTAFGCKKAFVCNRSSLSLGKAPVGPDLVKTYGENNQLYSSEEILRRIRAKEEKDGSTYLFPAATLRTLIDPDQTKQAEFTAFYPPSQPSEFKAFAKKMAEESQSNPDQAVLVFLEDNMIVEAAGKAFRFTGPNVAILTLEDKNLEAWPFQPCDALANLLRPVDMPALSELPLGHTVVYGYSTESHKSGEHGKARTYASGKVPGVHRARQVGVVIPPLEEVKTKSDVRSLLRATFYQPGGRECVLTNTVFSADQAYAMPDENSMHGAPVFHVPYDESLPPILMGFHIREAVQDELYFMWSQYDAYKEFLDSIKDVSFPLFSMVEGLTPVLADHIKHHQKGTHESDDAQALIKALRAPLK